MTAYDLHGTSNTIGTINDLDKERLFSMALNEENDVNTLLSYYRDRINRFDNEREGWLDRYNKIRTTQDEAHRQEWELQKRKDEIFELQRTLDEAKLRLFNERQEIISLIKENDRLKLKELEDRKKISELTALGEPVEQEIVFFKDVKPETINRYMRNDLSLRTNKENYENMLKRVEGRSSSQVPVISKTGKNVVKTIYLPNDKLNKVAIENEELRRTLEEKRAAWSQEVEELREHFRENESSLFSDYEKNQEEIRSIIQANQNLERDNIHLVRDYLELILESDEVEKQLNEENELSRLKNSALSNKLRIFEKKSKQDNQASAKFVEKTSEGHHSKYRVELRQKEEDLTLLKDQYAQIQQIYLQRMKELEENLTKLAKKYATLEKRRLLENEGFRTDVRKFKTRLLEDQKIIESNGAAILDNNLDEEGDENKQQAYLEAVQEELKLIQKQAKELETKLDKARKFKG